MRGNAARILLTVLRVGLPLALLVVGIASLVYGIGHHSAVVSVEQEIEIDLTPPPGFGAPGFGAPGFGPPGEGFDPSGPSFGDPRFGDPGLAGPPPWLGPPPPSWPR